MSDETPLLAVRNLSVGFETDDGLLRAVDSVSFELRAGRTLGLVGESGCGKTVTASSIMRLLPQPSGRILGGEIRFEGRDLAQATPEQMQKVRGARIGMVFQEPMSALNPVHTIGRQLSEVFLLHQKQDRREALARSVEMLRRVGIPSPEVRVAEYPHQLSGGMRQRVVIAMALACNPSLLIADEPTTALDVTVQAQILTLIQDLQQELGMAVLLITHDLGVIAETCDDVVVMYAGRIAEQAPVEELFGQPKHPYTRGLLASIPRPGTRSKARLATIEGIVPGLRELPAGCRFQNRCPYVEGRCRAEAPPLELAGPAHAVSCFRWRDLTPGNDLRDELPLVETHVEKGRAAAGAKLTPLLEVQDVKTHFPVKGGILLRATATAKAVDGVSFQLAAGETLGLVGESGCGKTTLGKTIVRLLKATAGRILFEGADLAPMGRGVLKPVRRHLQMVFQDPAESLNSRHTVGEALEEPFIVHGIGTAAERRKRVGELLGRVGLSADAANRYPFEFSGGQRQRIGIARALALNPRLIICDEPVSALDVSIQSQVLNLLLDLQREFGLSYLFIAHNLAVVKHVSDRIAVMYLGKIVELGGADDVYAKPRHPYTQALLASIPEPDPRRARKRTVLAGDIPSPINPPPGCPFHPRCPHATDRCRVEAPLLRKVETVGAPSHAVSCHYDL